MAEDKEKEVVPTVKRIVKPAPLKEDEFGSNAKIAAKFDKPSIELPETRPLDQEKPSHVNAVFSPLIRNDPNDGLRVRANWHQTWKRDDEFEAARDTGYVVIRKQLPGTPQKPGFETGEVMTKTDADGTIIAMEVPQWVYDDHLNALAVHSHRLYNSPEVVMKGFQDKTGRDLSSKKEQVSVQVDYESQREVLHR